MAARLIHTVGVGCGTLRLVALHDMYFRHKDLFGINTVVNGRPVHSRSKNLVPTASQFRVSMASDTENVTAEHLRMIERSEAVTKATGPSSLLLTTASVTALKRQVEQLAAIADHFGVISRAIYTSRLHDQYATRLRRKLYPYFHSMHISVASIERALAAAGSFYSTEPEEYRHGSLGRQATQEDATKLFDPSYQTRILAHATEVVHECEVASIHARSARAKLVLASQHFTAYIQMHQERNEISQKRSESILPMFVYDIQDFLWGKTDLTPLTAEQVQELATSFVEGTAFFSSGDKNSLLQFIDNLQAHFQQFRQIATTPEGLLTLGYSNLEDYKRLYQERLQCIDIIAHMQNDWLRVTRPFVYGREELSSRTE